MRQSFLLAAALSGLALIACALSIAPRAAVAAETAVDEYVFKLASGGEIRGKFLNLDERPRKQFLIETSAGGKLTLGKEDVAEFTKKPARDLEYERLRPTYPDTVEGQLALAEWCKQNQLLTARKTHLERVVQLDPGHAVAHKALGHRLVDGKWMTYEDYMHDVVGKTFLPGLGWVTAQEAQLRNERHTREVAEAAQFRLVQRLSGMLDARDRRQQTAARDDLLKIRDPNAVKAIAFYKDPKREKNPAARKLLVQVLSNIPSGGAVELMIDAALTDPDEDVRWEAIQILAERKLVLAVRRFVERLHDNSEEIINRAGFALGYMEDKSAIGPLIDALISTHIRTQTSGGGTSATFPAGGSSGGGGLSSGTKVTTTVHTYRNARVLESLRKLAGQGVNFDYNVDQWRAWYAAQKRVNPQDIRREK